jgi:hypothetical protein
LNLQNPTSQAPEKLQVPSSNGHRLPATLAFAVWSFSGVWILGFGVFIPLLMLFRLSVPDAPIANRRAREGTTELEIGRWSFLEL